jgi:hypothetical protein
MRSIQQSPQVDFTLAEDGEALGTIRQFSNRLNLPESQVLPCLQEHADQSILLRADGGSDQVLMLDAEGVGALLGCAASTAVDSS